MPLPLPGLDDSELRQLIEAARTGPHGADEVAALARHLAASGVELSWDPALRTTDLASTGGPASLTTLLCPIALVGAGRVVVKLGVPGRPAGAIDTLGTIPGYRTRLEVAEVRELVASTGFAQFLADERFAPLDDRLFTLRKKLGAVGIPDLTIASSLAKKVAVGVRTVGLEVRVGKFGNLGATRDSARRNARRFCEVAASLGIEARAFLSPQDHVPQPWIGRGETLIALASALGLRPLDDAWLQEHVRDCLEMAGSFGHGATPLVEIFERHLVGQGASLAAFVRRVDEVTAAERVTIESRATGVLEVDLETVRDVIVRAQADADGVFRDPLGVKLLARPGHRVTAGQPIAAVRSRDAAAIGAIEAALGVVDSDERVLEAIEVVV